MIDYAFLQSYWWVLVSILGALLVFLLFVQGGQTMIWHARNDSERSMMVNSLGRKWEYTFTTLVTFGGAFFASFPLFYSTSFGGAYWLWMLILFSFVLQAVSYEFRSKQGNVFGRRTFDAFLFFNGIFGCVLLGVAVAMFFFGADFRVEKQNLLVAASPTISTWAPTHGLEAIANWRNLMLGVVVLFLARTAASLYFINNINDDNIYAHQRMALVFNAGIFVVFFLAFVAVLLTASGYQLVDGTVNEFEVVKYKYLYNLIDMWWAALLLVVGVLLVLFAVVKSIVVEGYRRGIWYFGVGVVLVVFVLFFIAGFNGTPYYPSRLDPASSLTIFNSSSSEFTLRTMSVVSLIIPFVLAYIFYVWRSMDKKMITKEEIDSTDHKY